MFANCIFEGMTLTEGRKKFIQRLTKTKNGIESINKFGTVSKNGESKSLFDLAIISNRK